MCKRRVFQMDHTSLVFVCSLSPQPQRNSFYKLFETGAGIQTRKPHIITLLTKPLV